MEVIEFIAKRFNIRKDLIRIYFNYRKENKVDINEVLNGNIFKVWAKFIIASVVGVVLNTIYTMVDGIFIGQGVGEVGLAGVNIAWPAVTLVVGIGL